jgi:hypothetical protein
MPKVIATRSRESESDFFLQKPMDGVSAAYEVVSCSENNLTEMGLSQMNRTTP